MKFYLNLASGSFAELLQSGRFVDNSLVIRELARSMKAPDTKYVCISRPRRFGKTVTANMLCTYYGMGHNAATLFNSLQIATDESYRTHLNQYNVIFIDMSNEFDDADQNVKKLKKNLTEDIGEELQKLCPELDLDSCRSLRKKLMAIYEQTKQKFVFIIDEWDCVMRQSRDDEVAIKDYLEFLKVLLKDKDHVALAYMTGILPIKKYGDHSALNSFKEYSILSPGRFAPYIGFTEDEVKTLCEANSVSFKEMSSWYDGYSVGEAVHIFNPNSVVNALDERRFSSYWDKTESSSEALGIYLRLNFKGLRDAIVRLLAGGEELIDTQSFENDLTSFKNRDHVLTLLVHLGYLTATPAESSYRRFRVRVPNREVREELEAVILDEKKYAKTAAALRGADKLLEALQRGDEQAVARGVARAHEQCCSMLTYNDENSLACALTLAFYSARDHYTLIRELPSGKGFADLVFIPHPGEDLPALLIELKYDASADSALTQIKDQHYPQALEAYRGNLILAGIRYDPKTKEHSCVIERGEN